MTPSFYDVDVSPDRMQTTHDVVRINTRPDVTLDYTIAIPKTWTIGNPVGSPCGPFAREVLGYFAESSHPRAAKLIVNLTRLAWDVSPLEWMRYNFERTGCKVAVARRLEGEFEGRVEVAGFVEHEHRPYVRRTVSMLDAARLITVEAIVLLSQWPPHHDALWGSLCRFDLEKPTKRAQVESWTVYEMDGLSFSCPATWFMTSRSSSGCQLRMGEAHREASLKIQVLEEASPHDRGQRFIASLRNLQLTANEAPEMETGPDRWDHRHVEALDPNGTPLVVRTGCLGLNDGRCVETLLLAPTRRASPLDWMRATQALAIVEESMRT